MSRAAPRISRDVIRAKRNPDPRRSVAHLAFIRAIDVCLACGAQGRCEAMHIRNNTDGATGLKPSDRFSVPGCTACHARQHRIGEQTFWSELGIDPLDVACRLWTISGDAEQGRRCIDRARARIRLAGEVRNG